MVLRATTILEKPTIYRYFIVVFTQHGAQKHILSCCILENFLLFLDSWNENTILVSFDAEKNPVIRRVCVHFGTAAWYISGALIEAPEYQAREGHFPSLLTSGAFSKWSQKFLFLAECGECSVFSRPGEKQFIQIKYTRMTFPYISKFNWNQSSSKTKTAQTDLESLPTK